MEGWSVITCELAVLAESAFDGGSPFGPPLEGLGLGLGLGSGSAWMSPTVCPMAMYSWDLFCFVFLAGLRRRQRREGKGCDWVRKRTKTRRTTKRKKAISASSLRRSKEQRAVGPENGRVLFRLAYAYACKR